VKTEDSGDVLKHNEDNRSNIDSGHSQTDANSALDASDVKSVITEYVLYLYHSVLLNNFIRNFVHCFTINPWYYTT